MIDKNIFFSILPILTNFGSAPTPLYLSSEIMRTKATKAIEVRYRGNIFGEINVEFPSISES